jgi:hypothetical protein
MGTTVVFNLTAVQKKDLALLKSGANILCYEIIFSRITGS